MRQFLLFFSGLLAGCSSRNDFPEEIIQPPAMKFIVWDMMLGSELSLNQISSDSTNINQKTTAIFQEVFSIHNITKEQFYQSFRYYQTHPPQNKILFDSLADYASRIRDNRYKRIQ